MRKKRRSGLTIVATTPCYPYKRNGTSRPHNHLYSLVNIHTRRTTPFARMNGLVRRLAVSRRSGTAMLRVARPAAAAAMANFHTSVPLRQERPPPRRRDRDPKPDDVFDSIRLKFKLVSGALGYDADMSNSVRLHVGDSKDPDSVRQLTEVYSFLIEAYVRESHAFDKQPQANGDAVVVYNRLAREFKERFPPVPPSRETMADYFKTIHMLQLPHQGVETLHYEDSALADDLKVIYALQVEKTGKFDETAMPSIAKDFEVPTECVRNWFKFFALLDSVPTWPDKNALIPTALASRRALESIGVMEPFFKKDEKLPPKAAGTKGKKDDGRTINVDIDADKLTKWSFVVGSVLLGMYFFSSVYLDYALEISFQDFVSKFLAKNYVKRIVVINNKTASIELNDSGLQQYSDKQQLHFSIGLIESFERNLRHVQDELEMPEAIRVPVVHVHEGSISKMLVNFLPTLLFLGAIYYMTKKAGGMGGMGGPLGFGKSTAKKFNQETNIKIKFKDVAGMNEAKEEVMEFVSFLQNPDKYEKLGAKIPRGAILSGPPGTGKTLIAKATAGEAGVPFYSVSGSEFVEMFVGVGASRVRDLFKTARQNAPLIVFVDEIDAIGKQRSKGNASGANDERETTLNQLLVEMDGFDTNDHVVVLAGTNRADILDKALMRPGRFDRHIAIDNPELQGRKEIFEVHLKKIKMTADIDEDLSGRLAALTPGFSGADIANVCNELALIAARFNAEAVTLRHFELAIERVIGGIEKKSKLLNGEEQKIVAFHEAGHAICGWYLKYASPLLKVSIIPRGQGALGYAQYLPPDQYLLSGLQLYDRMVMTLGGRVSEELNFKSVTSGAHDDFKKVTNIAQQMVMRFGMSPKVGMVNYADTRDSEDLTKPFSEETNRIIDEEVQRIVGDCYNKCRDLLTERAAEVKLVAEELLRKEFITREDMIRLLGKRPFPETNDAFDKYLDKKPAFKDIQPNNERRDDDVI